MMMKEFQSMTLWTPKRTRGGASTGTRITTSRIQYTNPKAGFASPIVEGVQEVGRYYFNYDPEAYYKQRLFGDNPSDFRWRYDLNKRLIGRPDYKPRALPSWVPSYGKKKFPKKRYPKFQEGNKYRARKRYGRYKCNFFEPWQRCYNGQTGNCNRFRGSNWKRNKVYGNNTKYSKYRRNRWSSSRSYSTYSRRPKYRYPRHSWW